MSKDFDDTNKKIDQSNKDNDKLIKEIDNIKNQINDISFKVDLMLEILNNFTIILSEEEEEIEDYDSDESWVPKEDDFWEDDSEA